MIILNYIVNVRELSSDKNYPQIKDMIGYKEPQKEKILLFLKSFEPVAMMAHGIKDYVTGSQDNGETVQLFNYGQWFWTNEMIYHFEKYDLKLKTDFINSIIK